MCNLLMFNIVSISHLDSFESVYHFGVDNSYPPVWVGWSAEIQRYIIITTTLHTFTYFTSYLFYNLTTEADFVRTKSIHRFIFILLIFLFLFVWLKQKKCIRFSFVVGFSNDKLHNFNSKKKKTKKIYLLLFCSVQFSK